MKFILFNVVVVAAGLVFLLTRTDGPVATTGRGVLAEAVLKVTEIGDQVVERLARVDPEASPGTAAPAKAGRPAGNADRESPPPPPAPPAAPNADETAKPPPQAPTGGYAIAGAPAKTAPPPLPPAIQVAPRETRAVPRDAAVTASAGGLEADVRRRRAEVLGEAARKTRVTVADGDELMTPAERRRELDVLVEQMELLYIDQIGG